jgi:Uma2 family endonuclease
MRVEISPEGSSAMTIRPDLPTSKEAYLRFIERQEGGKFEWDGKRGVVVMMVDVTRAHMRVLANVQWLLATTLNRGDYDIAVEAFGLDVDGSTRFPDLMVEARHRREMTGRRAIAPLLLVEVLSPSSLYVDLNEKPVEYLGLKSLQSYVVFAQDSARAWIWTRDGGGAFPERPVEVEGLDKTVSVPGLRIDLPLAEVFRDVIAGDDAQR